MASAGKRFEKTNLLLASGTRADRRPRTEPSHFNGLAYGRGRVFYLAVVLSPSRCSHVPPLDVRSGAMLCELPSFRTGRRALPGLLYKQTIGVQLSDRRMDVNVDFLLAGGGLAAGRMVTRRSIGCSRHERKERALAGAFVIVRRG